MWMNLYTEDIHVAPVRAVGSGYRFAHPTLRGALGQLTTVHQTLEAVKNPSTVLEN